MWMWGIRCRSWLRHCATCWKVAGSIPDGHWNFSVTYPFRLHYGPRVDSASKRNEYQEYFLGGKGGQCVGLTTLPPSCTDCLEIWGASTPPPLESPGPLQACNGIAVPFFKHVNGRYCCKGGRLVPRAVGKIYWPSRESNHDSSGVHPVA